ncbi:MAG: hypothetical protein KAY32_05035 [Candidatus Eisenbacteria sp.]|nr:hypothetical protein [Candidatus Eisenbacteria bacterium]
MLDDRSQHTYPVGFDERRESWFVTAPADQQIPLDRSTLARLIALYNEIHRGDPLSLIERRVLYELGRERSDLQETIRSLYDFIDTEVETPPEPAAARNGRIGTCLRRWLMTGTTPMLRLLERIRVP